LVNQNSSINKEINKKIKELLCVTELTEIFLTKLAKSIKNKDMIKRNNNNNNNKTKANIYARNEATSLQRWIDENVLIHLNT